jgi:hypothetical protein
VLHHNDGVGARWNGRTGHNLDCFAGVDLACEDLAGANFTDDAKLGWRV